MASVTEVRTTTAGGAVDQTLRLALLVEALEQRVIELRRRATGLETCLVLDDLRDYTIRCCAQAQAVKGALADGMLAAVEGVPS